MLDYAFFGCELLEIISLPSTVTEIGACTFEGCSNLRAVALNAGLQKLQYCIFYGCKSLIIIKLPSTVTEIGCSAFGYCSYLSDVVLNEGLQKIGDSAFYECRSLKIISLPSTVTEIDRTSFNYCTSLRVVIFNERPQAIAANAFIVANHWSVQDFLQCQNVPTILLRLVKRTLSGKSQSTNILNRGEENFWFLLKLSVIAIGSPRGKVWKKFWLGYPIMS